MICWLEKFSGLFFLNYLALETSNHVTANSTEIYIILI